MKLELAKRIMADDKDKILGYRVYFDQTQASNLVPDYFPEDKEPLIGTLNEAVYLANKFAEKAGVRYVNIQVKKLLHNGTAFPAVKDEETFQLLRSSHGA